MQVGAKNKINNVSFVYSHTVFRLQKCMHLFIKPATYSCRSTRIRFRYRLFWHISVDAVTICEYKSLLSRMNKILMNHYCQNIMIIPYTQLVFILQNRFSLAIPLQNTTLALHRLPCRPTLTLHLGQVYNTSLMYQRY